MDEFLIDKIEVELFELKSLKHMAKNNKYVLSKLNYYHIPEMCRSFNSGIIFSLVIGIINQHHSPQEPPNTDIQKAYQMILKFIGDGYVHE